MPRLWCETCGSEQFAGQELKTCCRLPQWKSIYHAAECRELDIPFRLPRFVGMIEALPDCACRPGAAERGVLGYWCSTSMDCERNHCSRQES